jgi:hypothetical protein
LGSRGSRPWLIAAFGIRFLAIGWPTVDTPDDEWRAAIDVNLKGFFGFAEALAPA